MMLAVFLGREDIILTRKHGIASPDLVHKPAQLNSDLNSVTLD